MSRSIYARLTRRFAPGREGPTRREVLKASLALGATMLLSRGGLLAQGKGKRVVVVGAGFAGLAAAHELTALGYEVTVVDARNRVGGRVLSFSDLVPGKNVEGGGELVGSNHPVWVAYADKFGLSFLDVTETEEVEFPVVLQGRRIEAEKAGELWEEMDALCNRMNADAAKVDPRAPWNSPDAIALDRRSLRSWIDAQEGSDLGKVALDALLMSDNGVSTSWQSYLGNLAMVAGGGGETFWSDSEVYRCAGGNDQLAKKLAATLDAKRVMLGVPAKRIASSEKGATVTLADGRVLEADDVIVAVAPSVWNRIDFDPGLPAALRVQMGANVKFLAAAKGRFWLDEKLAPDFLSDGDISQTWDGTDNQPGEEGACMVAFSGGPPAQNCGAYESAERAERYLQELERVYTGIRKSFTKSRYMGWTDDLWTQGSYSFPAQGEVTGVGPLLQQAHAGRIHFAGEHCCYAFVGYMEGALQSGVTVAKRLAERDGAAKPK